MLPRKDLKQISCHSLCLKNIKSNLNKSDLSCCKKKIKKCMELFKVELKNILPIVGVTAHFA